MIRRGSLRTKLMLVVMAVASLTLATAGFGIAMINRLATDAESVLDELVPMSFCSKRAMMAVQEGLALMHQGCGLDDPVEMEQLRVVTAQFRQSVIHFDMFHKAMIYGSQSAEFSRSYGGLTLASWQRAEWDRMIIVPPASAAVRQAAEEADGDYRAFAKAAQAALHGQQRLLRLRLQGQAEEARREELAVEQDSRQARDSARQVNIHFERALDEIHDELNNAAEHLRQTKQFTRWALAAFSGAILVVALGVGWVFASRALLRPIVSLHQGTERVGAGDLDHRVGTDAKDELGQLAQAFDRMTENLQGTTKRLEQEVAEHRAAEEALQLNEARLETLVHLNDMTAAELEELTDFTLEAAVQLTRSTLGYLAFMNDDETVLTMHSWSRTAMADCAIIDKPIVYPVVNTGLWGEAVRQRQPIITNDYAAPNPLKKGYPAGHVQVRRHMNVPIFDGPRIVIVAGVGNKASPYDESDVRQLTLLMQGMWQLVVRRRTQEALLAAHDSLEARVMQRTLELAQSKTELERSNQDLEQFAYAASHDLQEPLRMVTSYVQLLQRRYQGQLDAAADEFIGFAVDGARRMQQLINDLLSYSRVNSRGHEFAPVDCGAALDDAVSNLSAAIAEHGAEIVRDPLPTVVADRTQLVQLFQNLVGNAIKFRGPQPPQVHVAAENDDCQWRFAVRDNGIGIDPKYAAQVFLVFRRLHTRAKYPGTGIGLAICKRIVERHGGRIWFESSPGQGATFYFTIPEQPPPA